MCTTTRSYINTYIIKILSSCSSDRDWETNNSGDPSGTLVHANAISTVIYGNINHNAVNTIHFNNTFTLTPGSDYFVVYETSAVAGGYNTITRDGTGNYPNGTWTRLDASWIQGSGDDIVMNMSFSNPVASDTSEILPQITELKNTNPVEINTNTFTTIYSGTFTPVNTTEAFVTTAIESYASKSLTQNCRSLINSQAYGTGQNRPMDRDWETYLSI